MASAPLSRVLYRELLRTTSLVHQALRLRRPPHQPAAAAPSAEPRPVLLAMPNHVQHCPTALVASLLPQLAVDDDDDDGGGGGAHPADDAAAADATAATAAPRAPSLWRPDLWGDDPSHLEPATLRSLVRARFRHHADGATSAAALDEGFAALRLLHEQLAQSRRSSYTLTEAGGARVLVEATSFALPGFGGVEQRWPYGYRIRIRNEGAKSVRLEGRHWKIRQGATLVKEVARGSPGVVGKQPILTPGGEMQTFEYYSSVELQGSRDGSMEGCFQMHTIGDEDEDVRFDAIVDPFALTSG